MQQKHNQEPQYGKDIGKDPKWECIEDVKDTVDAAVAEEDTRKLSRGLEGAKSV